MKDSKKTTILLSVLLLIIFLTGMFIIIKNKDNKENKYANGNKSFQDNRNNQELESDKFYYIEEFAGELAWEGNGYDKLINYNGEIARLENGVLKGIKSKQEIYDIPYMEYDGGYMYINGKEVWNIKYDNDIKKVIAKSFDYEGNEQNNIELNDFQGLIVDDSYTMIDHIKISDDYIYLSAHTNAFPTLHIFTKTGDLKYSYENITSFDVDNKGNYIYTTAGSESLQPGFYMISSETGTEIFKNTSYQLNPIRFSHDGELIYGFDKKINAFSAKDGRFKESIFDFGMDSTYLLDDYEIQDFLVSEEGDIYYSIRNKMKNSPEFKLGDVKNLFYTYAKQQGERVAREISLTITAPYRNDFMEEAIKRYELKYPGEEIEYDYVYNNYSAFLENAEEYGSKLALDIITGDIGDIVHTGGAGVETHNILATDIFVDLTDLIEKDKNYKNLNKDVLNALRINKRIRGLPITYMFYQYELNEDLEKQLGLDIDFEGISWSEVLELLKTIEEKTPDKYLFTYPGEQDIWEHFGELILIANMPDLIDIETKKVDLKQQWFKDLLINLKECSKSKNFLLSDIEYKLDDRLHGSLLALTLNRDKYYGDSLYNFDKYNKTNKSRMIPNFTGEKNNNRIGYSISMYSINNRSDRKEKAWKFLSFLLEEDIQFIASRERTGMPINEEAVERMIGESINMHRLTGINIDKYNNAFIENSHKIDYLYNMGYLRLDISRPVGLYMEDKVTLDEALKMAEENVIIRLNE